MAGGKETPRQRMIGILYLVLLGLIALDVPENLLDAFKNISLSLSSSTKNVQTGLQTTVDAFKPTKLKEQPEKPQAILVRAQQAQKLADDLNANIETIKKKLVDESGG